MKNCRKYRAFFIAALYNELAPEQRKVFEVHLSQCDRCASAFAEMQKTLQVMHQRKRPEPDADFWDGYWARLAGQLPEKHGQKHRHLKGWLWRMPNWRFLPGWLWKTASAVALVVIGILIGQYLLTSPENGQNKIARNKQVSIARQAAFEKRTQDYLERSKVLLLGLINFDPATEDPYVLDLPQKREVSRKLLREAAMIKQGLSAPPDRRLRQLFSDLELVLLQIANIEENYDVPGIDLLKSTVDRRGILLKINLEEMRNSGKREQAKRAGTKPANKIKM